MNSVYLDAIKLQKYIDSVYAEALNKFHLSVVEAHTLAALRECGAMRPADLAQAAGRAQTSFTPTLDHLQELGYVTRGDNADDRRSVLISLTEEGKATAELVAHVLTGADLIVQRAFLIKEHVARSFIEKYTKVPY